MRGESGQATIEFSAMIVWLIVAALCAWEIGLAAWAEVSAANAARTAARLYSRTGDSASAIADTKQSLSGFVSHGADVHFDGEVAVVHLNIPIVFPWFDSGVKANSNADMPHTG
jgi:hypothetical protein